jgi:hypothetical protein
LGNKITSFMRARAIEARLETYLELEFGLCSKGEGITAASFAHSKVVRYFGSLLK